MIENIKTLFNRMLPETKKKAFKVLQEEFDYGIHTIKQNWIWGGLVPEEYQPKVVEIFQVLLKMQSEQTEEIVREIEVVGPKIIKP